MKVAIGAHWCGAILVVVVSSLSRMEQFLFRVLIGQAIANDQFHFNGLCVSHVEGHLDLTNMTAIFKPPPVHQSPLDLTPVMSRIASTVTHQLLLTPIFQ
jgi:hypothetical protein